MPFPPVDYPTESEKFNLILQICFPVSGIILIFLIVTMVKFRVQTRFMSSGCLLNFFAIELVDVIQGLVFSIAPSDFSEMRCHSLGFIAHFLQLASIGWTTCLAYQTYMIYCVDSSHMNASLARWYIQIYGIAVASCAIAVFVDAYGDVGNHLCWIKDPVVDVWLYWIYMAINCVASGFLMYRVLRKIKADFVGTESSRRKSVVRTTYFVGMIMTSWVFMGVIHALNTFLDPFPAGLAYLYAFVSSSIGGVYALAFFLHSNVLQFYRRGGGTEDVDIGGEAEEVRIPETVEPPSYARDQTVPRTFASLVNTWTFKSRTVLSYGTIPERPEEPPK